MNSIELKPGIPTVTSAMQHLAWLGIVRETTGRNCDRIYAYDKYLEILIEGTEPLGVRGRPRYDRLKGFDTNCAK
jgi:hypothetical protein